MTNENFKKAERPFDIAFVLALVLWFGSFGLVGWALKTSYDANAYERKIHQQIDSLKDAKIIELEAVNEELKTIKKSR